MNKNTISWLNESQYTKPLPPACKMCAEGSKMVILITGLCSANCYYCPLSNEKTGKDRIFADEWELSDENDTEKLVLEAEYIEATGAGITGGDPLIIWKRTKRYIEFLKNQFGTDFHIHLYTSGLKNSEHIVDLVNVGLDEIRFHPDPKDWYDMDNSPIKHVILDAVNMDVDVAIEIPVIPGKHHEILSLINWADKNSLSWVNLNELEFSETNAEELGSKNFVVKNDISSAVLGSQEIALNVLEKTRHLDIGVHYCSSSFKDGIQLRNRIKRRAKNTVKNHEIVTEEGTILKGVIYTKTMSLSQLYDVLINEYDIEEENIHVVELEDRVEIALWILEEIAGDLKKQGFECYMVEEYPTADKLEVERTPLPI